MLCFPESKDRLAVGRNHMTRPGLYPPRTTPPLGSFTLAGGGYLQTFEMLVTFSTDSIRLPLASVKCTAMIWNDGSGDCLQTLEGCTGTVQPVAFSPRSNRLALAPDDRTIRIWYTSSGNCLQTLIKHMSILFD